MYRLLNNYHCFFQEFLPKAANTRCKKGYPSKRSRSSMNACSYAEQYEGKEAIAFPF